MSRAKKPPKREPIHAPPWSECVERFGAWQASEERSAHTIRAYASDLDMFRAWFEGDNGEPLTVQKELMRHASIQTTLNTYGGGMMESMREAHGRVVRQAIAP